MLFANPGPVRTDRTIPLPTIILLAVFLFQVSHAAENDGENREDMSWTSDGGLFTVSYTSLLAPIQINRLHQWVLHLEDNEGEPVSGASISVEGGMPAHDHGLPTNPRVTEYPGNGDYLLEGLRFHMQGRWEIELTIEDGTNRDTVTIPLDL